MLHFSDLQVANERGVNNVGGQSTTADKNGEHSSQPVDCGQHGEESAKTAGGDQTTREVELIDASDHPRGARRDPAHSCPASSPARSPAPSSARSSPGFSPANINHQSEDDAHDDEERQMVLRRHDDPARLHELCDHWQRCESGSQMQQWLEEEAEEIVFRQQAAEAEEVRQQEETAEREARGRGEESVPASKITARKADGADMLCSVEDMLGRLSVRTRVVLRGADGGMVAEVHPRSHVLLALDNLEWVEVRTTAEELSTLVVVPLASPGMVGGDRKNAQKVIELTLQKGGVAVGAFVGRDREMVFNATANAYFGHIARPFLGSRNSTTRSSVSPTFRDKSFGSGDIVKHVQTGERAAVVRVVYKSKESNQGRQARRVLLLMRLSHNDEVAEEATDIAKQSKELLFPASWDSYMRVPASAKGWPKGVNENEMDAPRKSISVDNLIFMEKVRPLCTNERSPLHSLTINDFTLR